MKRLLHAPHRLFFFAAVGQLLLASLWWAGVLAARSRGFAPPLAEGLEAPRVHAFLMIYGFFPLFIFGFLFTAGPRWLAMPAPAPREYVPPALSAAFAALLLHVALAFGTQALAVAIALYLGAWLWILARFVKLIVASQAEDREHAIVAAWALAAGALGLVAAIAWLLLPSQAAGRLMEVIGLWGFLVPLFCAVCHRMLPFFTASALPFVSAWRPGWVLSLLVGGSVAHGLLEAGGLAAATWIVDLPMAIAMLALALRWGITQSFANRLLAMLHVGFVWLGIAYLLHAAQSALRLAGVAALGLAPVHALTIGFLSSLMVAMVSRVSCGHSGRVLAADRLTWVAFLLLQAAAVLRVVADVWVGAHGALLLAAVGAWLACFGAWSWRYLPIYLHPRVDGKAG